jgi:hypothetical protein
MNFEQMLAVLVLLAVLVRAVYILIRGFQQAKRESRPLVTIKIVDGKTGKVKEVNYD